MKKVAIMTWFHFQNFGTALQVFALSKIVRKLGYQDFVINYIPEASDNRPFILRLKDYKYVKQKLILFFQHIMPIFSPAYLDKEKSLAFHHFIKKNIRFTDICTTFADLYALNNNYDAFVCGSDQIWAPTLYNSKYFLDFVDNTDKMVAYAPSIGLEQLEDSNVKELMKKSIQRFKHLSVREEQGSKIIKDLVGVEARVVLDPTLLLDKSEWSNIGIFSNIAKPYMLCYFLGYNKRYWRFINKLSRKLNLKSVIIPIFARDYLRNGEVILGVGPKEFIGLIQNARLVCTDSFHGVTFSVVFERPFIAFKRFSDSDPISQNSRVYNLLKILGLEDRLFNDEKADYFYKNAFDCDYINARKRLENTRNESLKYLRVALEESTSSAKGSACNITPICCGCGVCKVACNQDAIDLILNNEGFLCARVNQEKCIQCGICKKVCPFVGTKALPIDKYNDLLFAARSTKKKTLSLSSSGGIAHEIAVLLCSQGYDVIGCIYDKEEAVAKHVKVLAGNVEELCRFQGSKYLQSYTFTAFNTILESSKAVIIGTPCQVAALHHFLTMKKRREDYLLVDLICHGVPSYYLWKKYLNEGAQRFGYGKNPKVIFRYKALGWRKMHIRIENEKSGEIYINNDKKDLFYRFYLLGNCYARSCYDCPYRTASAADIRLGDYWGDRYKKDTNGVSMVLPRTSVGLEILHQLERKGSINLSQTVCSDYWDAQQTRNFPIPLHYEELIAALKNPNITLEDIAESYCAIYEKGRMINKFLTFVKNRLLHA